MAIYYGIVNTETEGYLLVDQTTGQLEIYESKECANNQLTYKGMKIVEIEVFMAKEL